MIDGKIIGRGIMGRGIMGRGIMGRGIVGRGIVGRGILIVIVVVRKSIAQERPTQIKNTITMRIAGRGQVRGFRRRRVAASPISRRMPLVGSGVKLTMTVSSSAGSPVVL